MKAQDKIELVSDLYHKGKLDVMELRDLDKPSLKYDIMVFMYIKEPDEYGFREYVCLDYAYGASLFNNQLGYGQYNACLEEYDRIYEALKRNKLLKGDK